MIYGDKKVKDMAESILPSKTPKKAREDRKRAHRKARRNAKMNPEYADVIERKRRIEIDEMKWERRGADNLSGMLRWAVEITKHLDNPQDRLEYVKKLLPDNLIGRHALSHIDDLEEFYIDYPHTLRFWLRNYKSERVRSEEERRAELVRQLDYIIATGGLKALNNALKRAFHPAVYTETYYVNLDGKECYKWNSGATIRYRTFKGHREWVPSKKNRRGEYKIVPCDCKPRLLLGAHDIEAFINEAAKGIVSNSNFPRWRHPEVSEALAKFLEKEAE